MNTIDKEKILPARVVIKALILVLIINFAFIVFMRVPVGKISLYNLVFPGRSRFPFGENPEVSYSLSLYNLDAMLASHEIISEYDHDAFNVFVIGDSSVWGFLQKPEETLTGLIRSSNSNKDIHIYNFGYPSLSILKDLMIFAEIKQYQPDLVVWMVTLESLPISRQLETPLVANNAIKAKTIIEDYGLTEMDSPLVDPLDFTLINRRRELADIIRLQLYGPLWAATGIDQDYPDQYNPATRDFEADNIEFYDFKPENLEEDKLALDVITETIEKNADIHFVVINEPILISQGANSDIRYNFYYPRWVYDQYRDLMRAEMDKHGIAYYDYWDIVPEQNFTNSAIHLDFEGETILAEKVTAIIRDFYEKTK